MPLPPILTDEDREIIRRLSDDVKRQQEEFAAQMEKPMRPYRVQYQAADGAETFVQIIFAATEADAEMEAKNLAHIEHLRSRFVKVWPA